MIYRGCDYCDATPIQKTLGLLAFAAYSVLSRFVLHSPQSLHHLVMQGLPPPVVLVLGCGFSFAFAFAFARVWLCACEDL